MTAQEAIERVEGLWGQAREIHRAKGFPGSIQPLLSELKEIEESFDPEVDGETLDEIAKYHIDMKRWAR